MFRFSASNILRDFARHLALSIRAILGLGSHAMIADSLGHEETAAKYRTMAQEFAKG